MPFLKRSNAEIRNPNIASRSFRDKTASAQGLATVDEKTAANVLSVYDPSKWLLSHVSIVASVDTELADPSDPKSDYYIRPEHSIFVNDNADTWERGVLVNSYGSFLGANVYVEHLQQPELARGKIVDAVLREIDLGTDRFGKPLSTLYCDILVATNRKHKELVDQIESGRLNAMSMGCSVQYSICSKCGTKAKDETEMCSHVLHYRGQTFYDKKGNERVIAELCGHKDDPKSNKFIESSWVRVPAFRGALSRGLVTPQHPVVVSMPKDGIIDYLASKPLVQDKHHALDKAASLAKVAEDDELLPEPFPSDEPTPEPGEVGEEGFADDVGFGEGFGDDGGFEEEPAAPEQAPLDEKAKEQIKGMSGEVLDNLLGTIKQDLVNWIKEKTFASGKGPGRGGANPYKLEIEGDHLLKAASPANYLLLRERYSVDAADVGNTRLASLLLVSSSCRTQQDWSKTGMSREEAGQVLGFLSNKIATANGLQPMATDIREFVVANKVGSRTKRAYARDLILTLDRTPKQAEFEQAWKWASLMEGLPS